jgi:hypothetical protein
MLAGKGDTASVAGDTAGRQRLLDFPNGLKMARERERNNGDYGKTIAPVTITGTFQLRRSINGREE